MSLSKEIFMIIAKHRIPPSQAGEATEDILKLFEKRIEKIFIDGDIDNTGRLSFYQEIKEMLK